MTELPNSKISQTIKCFIASTYQMVQFFLFDKRRQRRHLRRRGIQDPVYSVR